MLVLAGSWKFGWSSVGGMGGVVSDANLLSSWAIYGLTVAVGQNVQGTFPTLDLRPRLNGPVATRGQRRVSLNTEQLAVPALGCTVSLLLVNSCVRNRVASYDVLVIQPLPA